MNLKSLFGLGSPFKGTGDGLLHLAFPHLCAGCGTDVLPQEQVLCASCIDTLPPTAFEHYSANPIEKIFWGRLPLTYATAQYFFTKDSLMQHLMHQLKYRGNKELGHYLGTLMGRQLAATNRFRTVDALVPLPLYPEKEFKRGFNQAAILCAGMAATMDKPVLNHAVIRTHHTESQTKKSRVERWQNMEGRFLVQDASLLKGKHLLLVDDVVTTGATLEACGRELIAGSGVRLSVATMCCALG